MSTKTNTEFTLTKKTYVPIEYVAELRQMIHSMGRKVSEEKGHSLKRITREKFN